MNGRMYIEFDGVQDVPVSLGTVTNITPTLNKRSMITPIPSLDMQSAFPIEAGNSKSYSISFKRVNPVSPDDSSDDSDKWSNRKWYEALTSCINRWQARTDGCRLRYEANDNAYLPSFTEQGYIKSITRTYSNDYNEVISGTLQFTVGRMHIHIDTLKDGGIDLKDMNVLISDSNENYWYILMYGGDTQETFEEDRYNLIESISITGGPESPFESAVIKIPKRKLMEQIPSLYGDIFATKNKLVLDVMSATGRSRRMFVTKVRYSGESITISAYTEAWYYHNISLDSITMGTPSDIIKEILTNVNYRTSFVLSGENHTIIMDYDEANDNCILELKQGVSVWRALQDCAMCLGCRIWFADGCAFIVDLRRVAKSPLATYIGEGDSVDLYGSGYCVGTASIDGEGIDPVANSVVVQCTSIDGTTVVNAPAKDEDSIEVYGEITAGSLNIPELSQYVQEIPETESAESSEGGEGSEEGSGNSEDIEVDPNQMFNGGMAFAQNYISYLSEPQRSITFTFKELYYKDGKRYWKSYFGAISQVDRIIDSYDKEVITNDSTVHDGKAYHKLAMSSYTRKYPQCTCEYSFGVIANIDLSSSTSQINSALGSR